MAHILAVRDGRIFIQGDGYKRPFGFDRVDDAADFLAQVIMDTRQEAYMAGSGICDPEENRGTPFDLDGFNRLVEDKLRMAGVEVA